MSAQSIVTEPSIQKPFDPRLPLDENFNDYEELYPKEKPELTTEGIIYMAVRCQTVFWCIVGIILLLVNIIRGNRLKSWRLYFLVSMTVFSWIGMTLYQDLFDYYFVQEVTHYPNPRSYYWCFRNLVHGLTLYLIILVLAHLSDLQHKSNWLVLIAIVILIPIVCSVGILICDLKLLPKVRYEWTTNLAIDTIRVFLYNFVTSVLLGIMCRSFCTSTLYGTYSERRSGVVVLVARWTYAFLLIHNVVSIASYVTNVISRLPQSSGDLINISILCHKILEEVSVFTIVMAVPTSYLVGVMSQCCCGVSRDDDLEMDKVDKIYADTWTTPSLRNGSTATQMTTTTSPQRTNAMPSSASNSGLQNGVVRRPKSAASEISQANSSLNSSFDSIGDLPPSRVASNPMGGGDPGRQKRRVRESYMEAVSMGSLDDRGSISSSEPIDL